MTDDSDTSRRIERGTAFPAYSVLFWLLSLLFALRVLGQAIQSWFPQPFLPAFQQFQGSSLVYPLLLSVQLVILGLMLRTSWRAQTGTFVKSHRSGRIWLWFGSAYMAGSLLRIGVGLTISDAAPWFRTWIPAFFHVVLAGFVLTLAAYHRRGDRAGSLLGEGWSMVQVMSRVWYPAVLAISTAAFFVLLAAGASPLLAGYVPIIVAGITIVALEIYFPENIEWRPSLAHVKADTAFMAVIQVLMPRLLAPAAAILLAGWTHEQAKSAWWSQVWPHDWPLAAQIVTMVLAVDLMRYWLHRAAHHYIPLWRLHEVHHSPDILYTLNVARFHPFEKVLHFIFDSVPFLLLGVAPEVTAGYFLLYSVNGFFQHSNLKLDYGWLNYVVGSAETHRWHHARDPKTASCNFGNTTIVWDLLFGTWSLPRRIKADEIGIMDRHYPKGFWAQMAVPFRRRDA